MVVSVAMAIYAPLPLVDSGKRVIPREFQSVTSRWALTPIFPSFSISQFFQFQSIFFLFAWFPGPSSLSFNGSIIRSKFNRRKIATSQFELWMPNARLPLLQVPNNWFLVLRATAVSAFRSFQSNGRVNRHRSDPNWCEMPCNSHAIPMPFPYHFHAISISFPCGLEELESTLSATVYNLAPKWEMGQIWGSVENETVEFEVNLRWGWKLVGLAGINDSVETPPHLGHRLRIGLVISTDSFIYSSSDGIKFDYWDRSSVKQWIDHLRWWIMEVAGWRRAELGTWNWNGMEWDETHLLMKWNRANRFHLNGWMIDWMRSNERVEWQLS